MKIITLPKQAIYLLHNLSKSVKSITGYRCRLSHSKELIHLLQLASITKNQTVKKQFFRFLILLDTEQLKRLTHSGIRLPLVLLKKIRQPIWANAFNILQKAGKAVAKSSCKNLLISFGLQVK